MYATYTYKAGSVAGNIIADIVLMLTGTTDPLLLSGDCVAGSTTITATELAGWTVHDAVAAANAQVLKAEYSDDAANFKYLYIDTNNNTHVRLNYYEAWNEVAHTGTNPTYDATNTIYSQRLNLAAGGRLDIRATARCFMIWSFQGGVYGNSQNLCASGLLERTRLSPWDTVAAGYPKAVFWMSWVMTTAFVNAYCPRSYDAYAQIDTTTSTAIFPMLISTFSSVYASSYAYSSTQITFTPNSAKVAEASLASFRFVNPYYANFGGEVSSLCGVYITRYNFGNPYDTYTVGADTYIVWTAGNYRFAIKVA